MNYDGPAKRGLSGRGAAANFGTFIRSRTPTKIKEAPGHLSEKDTEGREASLLFAGVTDAAIWAVRLAKKGQAFYLRQDGELVLTEVETLEQGVTGEGAVADAGQRAADEAELGETLGAVDELPMDGVERQVEHLEAPGGEPGDREPRVRREGVVFSRRPDDGPVVARLVPRSGAVDERGVAVAAARRGTRTRGRLARAEQQQREAHSR